MKNLIIGLIGAAALAGCCNCNWVESDTTFAQEVLAPYVKSGELPGAINVFYKAGVQETCCIGYADVAAKREITLDDVYMQCSQTKGFCGVTVAKLVEEGKLRLDDPAAAEGGFLSSAGLSGRDDLEVSVYGNDERMVLVSRVDNLGKGASGAAIQNMNIVLGVAEGEGLKFQV